MTPICLSLEKKRAKKVKFTDSEDRQLIALVGNNGENANWDLIAFALGNRTPRQCKDRFHAYLAPGLNKGEWTAQEDKLLLDLVEKFGQKWKTLAPSFNGRPEVSLKNRYRLLQRRINKQERLAKAAAAKQEAAAPMFQEPAASSPSDNGFDDAQFLDVSFYDSFGFDDLSNQFFF